jgi:energy-coupling factor transporter ATP-binding protein EcfA2
VVRVVIDAIAQLKARLGLTVLMAEQNFQQALRVADRGYVIVHGSIAFEGRSPRELRENDLVRKLYLGQDPGRPGFVRMFEADRVSYRFIGSKPGQNRAGVIAPPIACLARRSSAFRGR